MRRRLPSEAEAQEILRRHKTRPAYRPAPNVARTLAPVIRRLDDRFGQGAAGLDARWPEIVGESLARVSRPEKLTKARGTAPGTLELRVVGAASTFVQHQSEEIMQRVNLVLGHGAVGRLRIVQGPIKPRPGPAVRASAPPPLPADLDQALLNALPPDLDPRLRDSLLRLGRGVARRR